MDLRQLRYFIEVAEREHVSEAVANVHVAQSAISNQIANLKCELEGGNISLVAPFELLTPLH